MLAGNWRVCVGVGGADHKRTTEAIAAAPRGDVLALRQCFEAALQHEGCHIPAAVSTAGPAAPNKAAQEDCRGTQRQKLFHVRSSQFLLHLRLVVSSSQLMQLESYCCGGLLKMRTMFETLSTKNAGIGLRDAVSSITGVARLLLSSAYAEPERTLGVLLPWSETDPAALGYVKVVCEELARLGWREG
jgi:hypothetical protein